MKFTAFIVEDETRSRELLQNLLEEYCPALQVVGSASSVEEAIKAIHLTKPQVLFLDIELHPGTGFDILQRTAEIHFQVIFTTAYDHYAIKAIKFSALDYLLKPIDVQELQSAVQRAIQQLSHHQPQQSLQLLLQNLVKKQQDYTISLSTAEGLEFIPVAAVLRLEANGAYTIFHLKDGRTIMVSRNLKEYENLLGEHGFFRIQNSHIVNLKEVKKYLRTDGGYAVMNDDTQLAISPKKKEAFLQLLSARAL
ncbi:MAG: LytR/AlgR family response regulator transcription factor [Pseudobacter sp.]|uniref:LytR/AlgR family response regulator transcription factor n=1 Tax=Pseudobacter sp. TaxID=2045420 RepID=UPI003F7E9021